jgi:hypothetical protein
VKKMKIAKGLLAWAAMWLVGFLLILSFGMLAIQAHAADQGPIRVRWCPEDAVHVGHGDFDGTRWDSYRCIARDDL